MKIFPIRCVTRKRSTGFYIFPMDTRKNIYTLPYLQTNTVNIKKGRERVEDARKTLSYLGKNKRKIGLEAQEQKYTAINEKNLTE